MEKTVITIDMDKAITIKRKEDARAHVVRFN